MFPHASVFPSKTQVVFKTFGHFEIFSQQRENDSIQNGILKVFLVLFT